MEYDIIVVGGGPAGSVFARELCRRSRRSGLRVLLLEKARMPRLKVCAGGIAPHAEAGLKRLGLWEKVGPHTYPVTSAELITPKGRSFQLAGKATASVIRRSVLDEILLREAAAAGVEVLEGVKTDRLVFDGRGRVKGVICGEEEYHAPYTVIAAGAVCPFREPDSLQEQITSCTAWFDKAAFPPNSMRMVFPKELSPHYAWLFPESDRGCNIGIGVYTRKVRAGIEGLHNIIDVYEMILRRYFPDVVSDAERIIPAKVFPIFPSKIFGECAYPGTFLIGDAARVINAYTGEGISFALESAEIAADCLSCGENGWAQLNDEYIGRLRKAMSDRLKTGRTLCRWGPFFLNTANFLSRFPPLRERIVNLMTKIS